MNRYFVKIAYNGADFSGWQNQKNAESIQGRIEFALTKLYQVNVPIVGCGRTDAGVHASQYYFHVDIPNDKISIEDLHFKLNNMLGSNIVIYNFHKVNNDAHARFDATSRSYVYNLGFQKNPFNFGLYYYYDQSGIPDFKKLEEAAHLLLSYENFFPFCKTNSDVETYNCLLEESRWERLDRDNYRFHITANRFLRGMVRLIVGMCLKVSTGKIDLQDVKLAMENQVRLEKAWSVPPQGLFLSQIRYPYIE